uniref:WAP domain-containing protein n=1 Tax=Gouania willdenowi TaxID=441366 RepID=A0A8C5FZT3_GOUWI
MQFSPELLFLTNLCPIISKTITSLRLCIEKWKNYPGVCRLSGNTGICIHECANDHDCPDSQKCCSNGCGQQCLELRTGRKIHISFCKKDNNPVAL